MTLKSFAAGLCSIATLALAEVNDMALTQGAKFKSKEGVESMTTFKNYFTVDGCKEDRTLNTRTWVTYSTFDATGELLTQDGDTLYVWECS